MRKIFNIPVNKVIPGINTIIRAQGIPAGINPDERTLKLAQEAISIFTKLAKPTGIIMELSKEDFNEIYPGEGQNASSTPVEQIYKKSNDLALYAVTIEEEICEKISDQFSIGEYALGLMLDTVASEGTELTAQALEEIYKEHLININRFNGDYGILRFSPGYCGWHISGQKKLFKSLHPEDIGIELNSSFLMQPLKSISGIIISGKKEIFKFDDSFPFCADCATHSCMERIEKIQKQ